MRDVAKFFDRFMELRKVGDFRAIQALVPYAVLVGFDVELEERGPVTILRQKESNTGNTLIPAVHGGVVGALLEHAASMQILWEYEVTRFPKIINLSVDYLRPCLATVDAYARGVIIRQGRSVTNVRVEAWQSDPVKPVAAAHVHFLTS